MTASSSGWTPLFLKDEPQRTGVNVDLERRLADRLLEAVDGDLGLLEDQLDELVVVVADLLEQVLARGLRAASACSSGISTTIDVLAEVVLVDDRLHRRRGR